MGSEGKLAGKSALVTGAGSGIGRAISLRLAREGARVLAADINEETARAVAAETAELGGEAGALRVDTSREADVQAAIEAVADAWGRVDIIVNNAGIAGPQHSWDRVISVNESGVFYGCLHGLQQMMLQGGGGSIINMASMAGLVGATLPGMPGGFGYAYAAAKHAVIGLTKQFGLDGARHNIRVNALCPGWIDTPLIAPIQQVQQFLDWAVENTPMGRLGRPEEVASAALFLACDDSSFMTGAWLVIDGGWTAR